MKYTVTFGDQVVAVAARNRNVARTEAARLFVDKFGLEVAPTDLVEAHLLRTHKEEVGGRPIANFGQIGEEDKQWLAGFLEGDGGMGIYDKRPRISITQKDVRVLEFIRDLVRSGNLYTNSYCSQLEFNGFNRCLPIIEAIGPHIVCRNTVERIGRVFNTTVEGHKPTIPWVVGFWDAEGSFSYSWVALNAYLGQKDMGILECVREVVGGKVGRGTLWLRKDEARDFIPSYLRYSHNPDKRENLLAVLYYLASENNSDWASYYTQLRGSGLL